MGKPKAQRPKKQESAKTPGASGVRRASLKAIGLFALFAAVLFALIYTPFVKRNVVDPFTDLVALTSGLILRVCGSDVSGSGSALTVNGVSLSIAFGCNGIEAFAIYLAALLAAPFPWRRKPWGVLVGFIGVFIFNQIRVIGLFWAARMSDRIFEYAHEIIGQTFVILLTMALFVWWGSRYGQGKKAKTGAVLA